MCGKQSLSARLVVLAIVSLAAFGPGCAQNRPVAPNRAATSAANIELVFDAKERVRLDRLSSQFAAPLTPELSAGLLVRLAFEGTADLDLFVTDPAQESVYFANSPTRSGGTLIEDQRCDNSSPRIEVVHFANPLRGRYRVGVDFHSRCQHAAVALDQDRQELYIVRVNDGERVLEREGRVALGRFEVIVLEFDLE